MVALTWLRGLVAHRRARLLVDRARRRRRRRAARVDRHVPVRDDRRQMTHARDRAASPSTGRSRPSPARDPTRVLAQVRGYPRRRARAAGRLRPDHAGSRPRAGGTTQPTGAGHACSASPTATRAPSRASCATLVGRGHRRPARPADGREPARQARRHGRDRPRRRSPPAQVRVDGVVDLPSADSLFQKVGAPVGAQPQAPPDNVVLLPQRHVRPARARPGWCARRSTRALVARAARQPERGLHAGLRHARATSRRSSPAAGSSATTSAPRSTRRRKDALYAELLFLFLGVPGAILAGLVTAVDRRGRAPTAAAATRALLRTRGASTRQLVAHRARRDGAGRRRSASRPGSPPRWSSARPRSAPRASAPATLAAVLWAGGAALAGLAIAAGVDRAARVARRPRADRRRPAARRSGAATARPWWARYGLDFARARRRRRSSSGRRRATATTSCSPPRASRRSRSTGTRCSRRCSAGSAPACSPTGSPTSSLRRGRDAAGARAAAARRRARRRPWRRRMGRQRRLLAARRGAGRADRRVRRLDRACSTPPTSSRPRSTRGSPTAPTSPSPSRPARASGRGRRPRSRRCPGVAQRRAAAAPLRLRRRRPAGPLRRATRTRSARPASCRTPWFAGRHAPRS